MFCKYSLLGLAALCSITIAAALPFPGGDDPAALVKAIHRSKHTLADGIQQVSKEAEVALSAKFEFDDEGKLALSIYTADKGLGVDAEHNVLQEYGGSPEQTAWAPGVEIFKDVTHVARSAQQATLMALARTSLLEVVKDVEKDTKGQVVSITPVLEGRKAFFKVRTLVGDKLTETKRDLFEEEEESEEDEKH
ncbi:MAG: hypothetical protein HZA53_17100 [Planctomycetes bacterium]|nr:hypothetical protein [Planctomycetota bacterium]